MNSEEQASKQAQEPKNGYNVRVQMKWAYRSIALLTFMSQSNAWRVSLSDEMKLNARAIPTAASVLASTSSFSGALATNDSPILPGDMKNHYRDASITEHSA